MTGGKALKSAADSLDASEDIAGVDAVQIDRRQRTRSQHHGRHTVSQRLGKLWFTECFDVVVGVDVDDARDHPLPSRIDDIGPGGVQWSGGDGGDTAVMNTDVSQRRRRACSIEPAPIGDHLVLWHLRPSWRATCSDCLGSIDA
jgi:hypothetical protein